MLWTRLSPRPTERASDFDNRTPPFDQLRRNAGCACSVFICPAIYFGSIFDNDVLTCRIVDDFRRFKIEMSKCVKKHRLPARKQQACVCHSIVMHDHSSLRA